MGPSRLSLRTPIVILLTLSGVHGKAEALGDRIQAQQNRLLPHPFTLFLF